MTWISFLWLIPVFSCGITLLNLLLFTLLGPITLIDTDECSERYLTPIVDVEEWYCLCDGTQGFGCNTVITVYYSSSEVDEMANLDDGHCQYLSSTSGFKPVGAVINNTLECTEEFVAPDGVVTYRTAYVLFFASLAICVVLPCIFLAIARWRSRSHERAEKRRLGVPRPAEFIAYEKALGLYNEMQGSRDGNKAPGDELEPDGLKSEVIEVERTQIGTLS